MPLGWTVEQFNAWVDSTFPDNQARLISESDLRDGFKNTVLRSDERASASELFSTTLNSEFIARSLKLSSTVYVDGVNGDDSRIGTTNDANTTTGRVKSLARVAELHSDKTLRLIIEVYGPVEITSQVVIYVANLMINIRSGSLNFKKKTIVGVGEGTHGIDLYAQNLCVLLYPNGAITTEGHGGYVSGSTSTYNSNQGAIRLSGTNHPFSNDQQGVSLYTYGSTSIQAGANTTIFTCGLGTQQASKSIYSVFRSSGSATLTLASGAALSEGFVGDRVFFRQYHPSSSTDANILDGETVISPTNNKLWTKRSGTIRDAMGNTFS